MDRGRRVTFDETDPDSTFAIVEGILDTRPGIAGATTALQAIITNAALIVASDKSTLPASTVDWITLQMGWKEGLAAVLADAVTLGNLFSQFDSTISAAIATSSPEERQKIIWPLMTSVNNAVLTNFKVWSAFGGAVETNASLLADALKNAGVTTSPPIAQYVAAYPGLVRTFQNRVLIFKEYHKRLSVDISGALLWASGDMSLRGVEAVPAIITRYQEDGARLYADNAAILTSWTTINWPKATVLPSTIPAF